MITFTRTQQVENQVTGHVTPVVSSVTGSAIQVRPSLQRYKALNLALATTPTLFFTPMTYGEVPQPGDAVTWAGKPYVVRDVDPIAPDGVVIAARVAIEGGA
jgi:hypothetical protein